MIIDTTIAMLYSIAYCDWKNECLYFRLSCVHICLDNFCVFQWLQQWQQQLVCAQVGCKGVEHPYIVFIRNIPIVYCSWLLCSTLQLRPDYVNQVLRM